MDNEAVTQRLIKYLDEELEGEDKKQLEQQLASTPEWAEQLNILRLARQAIYTKGLTQKVGAIREEMVKEQNLKPQTTSHHGKIRRILTYGQKIAAAVLIGLVIAVIYQYISATPEKIYKDLYTPYTLSEARGSGVDTLQQAFKVKEYKALLTSFEKKQNPTVADYFFAGAAYLETGNPLKAIRCYLTIQQMNEQVTAPLFVEDTQYYLALAYLANHEPAKALPLMEAIVQQPHHAYRNNITNWQLQRIKWSVGRS